MKTYFADASRLLIENWDIVKQIHESEGTLASELRDFLFSIETDLTARDWWSDQWHFERYQDSQVYIVHDSWKRAEDYAIWLGVERFTPEALFGTDAYASMYVWVSGGFPQLLAPLRQLLANRGDCAGDISAKANRYVVTSPLRKCLPEEIDGFSEVVGGPILEFFDYHAGLAGSYGQALEQVYGKPVSVTEE